MSALVPTLGLSPWLVPCLQALRREGGNDLEILLVFQGEEPGHAEPGEEVFRLADTVIRLGNNLGFAAANNLGLAQARGEILATVNDDVIVEEGWLDHLLRALEAHPEAAAVQGVNLRLDEPQQLDGWGLGWNRSWQAVQLGHLSPAKNAPVEVTEVFGVSATAALYRRNILRETTGPERKVFDERLFAYYEDVELAIRLRSAGHTALVVPSARARHAGSSSGRQMPWGSRQLIYGNRYLVLAHLFGRGLWRRLPRIMLRDLLDLGRALLRREGSTAAGILAGGIRAILQGRHFLHFDEPCIPARELRRFQLSSEELVR